MVSRDPNTGLIRASAIALVLIHHVGQSLSLIPAAGHRYTSLGIYGVDLFFVLSGWLIGRLYWVEKRDFGEVNVLRFWVRRWFRTIPPLALCFFCACSVQPSGSSTRMRHPVRHSDTLKPPPISGSKAWPWEGSWVGLPRGAGGFFQAMNRRAKRTVTDARREVFQFIEGFCLATG